MSKTTRYLLAAGIALYVPAGAVAQTPAGQAKPTVQILVNISDASPATLAARDLRDALAGLCPAQEFVVVSKVPAGARGPVIHVGTAGGLKDVPAAAGAIRRLAGADSYVVAVAPGGKDAPPVAVIVGADGPGVVHGVWALLRKLGFGPALDGDIVPPARDGPLSFDGWDLADRPLCPRRFVFNWHNFLSGCSSWDIDQWRRWIVQSQKMGYSAVMVHAYGNNPMAGFAFDGLDKPVGYLSSTRVGRDWATMHVNDVRRLIGGQVFDSPVFGSSASVAGSDAQRTAAARKLMAQAFDCAEKRGVDVIFAVDIDTTAANPQPLIARLPERARFNVGDRGKDFWLPRPDTPEGYAYYKAQVAGLMAAYPQIDTLVMWFRTQGTPMSGLRIEQLPESWRAEYQAVVDKEPQVGRYWRSVGIFAMGKVARAFEKALKEIGREDVSLGLGTWTFDIAEAGDRFMPAGVGLYPLDYAMLSGPPYLAKPGAAARLAAVASHRPIYPVLWAHHDDGKYVGPPFAPPEKFCDLLAAAKCDSSGFGIIHWTTRPLDPFFIGLSDSVWQSSRNQSAADTCRRMARAMVGPAAEEAFGKYLHHWLTGLPMIARETSPAFIPNALKGYDEALAACRKRLAELDAVDAARLTERQRKWIEYYRDYERFVMSVYANDGHYRRASELAKADLAAARAELAKADVPAAIRLFAEGARLPGASRGEQGLIVSLNLRWYVHYVRLAQQLGSAPVLVNYAPTSHDPLAQSPGRLTVYVDGGGRFWDVQGQAETGAAAYGELAGYVAEPAPAGADAFWEVRRSGIQTDQPITLDLSPIGGRGKLAPGRYRLTVLLGEAPGGVAGPCTADVEVYVPGRKTPLTERVTLGARPQDRRYDIELSASGSVGVKLKPVSGAVRVCGLALEAAGAGPAGSGKPGKPAESGE